MLAGKEGGAAQLGERSGGVSSAGWAGRGEGSQLRVQLSWLGGEGGEGGGGGGEKAGD